jgi:undecaprenyl diphosphate synthase
MKELKIPSCVGIIMDGNRRWAKEHGLPKLEGHRTGSEKLKEIITHTRSEGVAHLIIYAFSTENWSRTPEEVSYLMNLFYELMQKKMRELGEEGVRIRCIGQRERFSPELQKAMEDIEKETEDNTSITLWIGLSYGGRAEIVSAVQRASSLGEITEESITRHLWTHGMPDPDIIIRTGGEKRLSGFLPWQSIYSELFFTDTLWPDFSTEEYSKILSEFVLCERRHGK